MSHTELYINYYLYFTKTLCGLIRILIKLDMYCGFNPINYKWIDNTQMVSL